MHIHRAFQRALEQNNPKSNEENMETCMICKVNAKVPTLGRGIKKAPELLAPAPRDRWGHTQGTSLYPIPPPTRTSQFRDILS